jgi:hypothetical protein
VQDYTGLVVAWPSIAQLAREIVEPDAAQPCLI